MVVKEKIDYNILKVMLIPVLKLGILKNDPKKEIFKQLIDAINKKDSETIERLMPEIENHKKPEAVQTDASDISETLVSKNMINQTPDANRQVKKKELRTFMLSCLVLIGIIIFSIILGFMLPSLISFCLNPTVSGFVDSINSRISLFDILGNKFIFLLTVPLYMFLVFFGLRPEHEFLGKPVWYVPYISLWTFFVIKIVIAVSTLTGMGFGGCV